MKIPKSYYDVKAVDIKFSEELGTVTLFLHHGGYNKDGSTNADIILCNPSVNESGKKDSIVIIMDKQMTNHFYNQTKMIKEAEKEIFNEREL